MNDGLALSIRQFVEAWRAMCSSVATRAMDEDGGVAYVFSGVPVAFFNVACVTPHELSASEVTACAERACAFASGRDVPWLLVVSHEALEPGVDAAARVEQLDLVPLMTLTGMLAERVDAGASVPPGLQLTVPEDDGACRAICDVNAAAYGMDLSAAQDILGRRPFWQGHVPVVGLVDGAPACSAAVLMVDGLRYVALVATRPELQRRGYGEAAMRRALEIAAQRHGERPTVLHATEAGRPIYERMGYRSLARHTLFIERRFLGEH